MVAIVSLQLLEENLFSGFSDKFTWPLRLALNLCGTSFVCFSFEATSKTLMGINRIMKQIAPNPQDDFFFFGSSRGIR